MIQRYANTLARLLLKASLMHCKVRHVVSDGYHITVGDNAFFLPVSIQGLSDEEQAYVWTQIDRAFSAISYQLA